MTQSPPPHPLEPRWGAKLCLGQWGAAKGAGRTPSSDPGCVGGAGTPRPYIALHWLLHPGPPGEAPPPPPESPARPGKKPLKRSRGGPSDASLPDALRSCRRASGRLPACPGPPRRLGRAAQKAAGRNPRDTRSCVQTTRLPPPPPTRVSSARANSGVNGEQQGWPPAACRPEVSSSLGG